MNDKNLDKIIKNNKKEENKIIQIVLKEIKYIK